MSEPLHVEELLASEASLRRLACSVVKGEDDINDVVQEAFLRALRFSPPDRRNISGWLATILRNVIRDRHRMSRKVSYHPDLSPLDGGVSTSTVASLCLEETVRILRETVAGLPASERDVLSLRYGEDLSWEQISKRLGISPSAARARLHKALPRIRAKLGPHMSEPFVASLIWLGYDKPVIATTTVLLVIVSITYIMGLTLSAMAPAETPQASSALARTMVPGDDVLGKRVPGSNGMTLGGDLDESSTVFRRESQGEHVSASSTKHSTADSSGAGSAPSTIKPLHRILVQVVDTNDTSLEGARLRSIDELWDQALGVGKREIVAVTSNAMGDAIIRSDIVTGRALDYLIAPPDPRARWTRALTRRWDQAAGLLVIQLLDDPLPTSSLNIVFHEGPRTAMVTPTAWAFIPERAETCDGSLHSGPVASDIHALPGRLRVDRLRPGEWLIDVCMPGYAVDRIHVSVPGNSNVVELSGNITACGEINVHAGEGLITDAVILSCAAVPSVLPVHYNDPACARYSLQRVLSGEGRTRLTNLAPGQYLLRAKARHVGKPAVDVMLSDPSLGPIMSEGPVAFLHKDVWLPPGEAIDIEMDEIEPARLIFHKLAPSAKLWIHSAGEAIPVNHGRRADSHDKWEVLVWPGPVQLKLEDGRQIAEFALVPGETRVIK